MLVFVYSFSLLALPPASLTRSLPLPSIAAGAAGAVLTRHVRRLPRSVEEVVSEMPETAFIQVFGDDFGTLVEAEAAADSGSASAPLSAKSAEAVSAEKKADARARKYCRRAWRLPAAKRWGSDAVWYNAPPRPTRRAVGLTAPPALRTAMDALRKQCGTDASFAACAALLLKYSDNAAADPANAKFRTVKSSARVFARLLAPHPAASDCLQALGFELRTDAPADPVCVGDICTLPPAPAAGGTGGEYVLGDGAMGALPALATHLRCDMRAAQLRGVWPVKLHAVLADACRLLPAPLLDQLTSEVCAPHVGLLLDHTDNLQRVESTIRGGAPAVEMLVSQLSEIRASAASAAGGGAAAAEAAGDGRVRQIGSPEEWYDLLMDEGAGLVVADFGAPWCGPCHAVRPLFAALSLKPEFGAVTFAYLDADLLPQIMGDNSVDSFPTFKFFRQSEEEDLPVVGGDIEAVEARIRSLI